MNKISNEDSYDKIADWFVECRRNSELGKAFLFFDFLELLEPATNILDVGCGGGIPIAKFLVKRGFCISGIDISAKMIEIAKKNFPQASFAKADIVSFSTEEKFGGIVAHDSLFHLEYEQHGKVFAKLYDFLKPNGVLLFTHGGGKGEIEGEMNGEKFFYSSLGPEKLRKVLEEIGFKIENWNVDKSDGNGYMIGIVKKVVR